MKKLLIVILLIITLQSQANTMPEFDISDVHYLGVIVNINIIDQYHNIDIIVWKNNTMYTISINRNGGKLSEIYVDDIEGGALIGKHLYGVGNLSTSLNPHRYKKFCIFKNKMKVIGG